jgi:hypothetical protein
MTGTEKRPVSRVEIFENGAFRAKQEHWKLLGRGLVSKWSDIPLEEAVIIFVAASKKKN